MKIELSDVSKSEMFNFISDTANDLELTESQAREFMNVLCAYGFECDIYKWGELWEVRGN